MAQMREYLVSFSPAERHAHGYTVKMSLLTGGERHEVAASSFADLEREVRRLAVQFGQTCSPYIQLKDRKARKPAGFDAWKQTVSIIDFPPTSAAAEG